MGLESSVKLWRQAVNSSMNSNFNKQTKKNIQTNK